MTTTLTRALARTTTTTTTLRGSIGGIRALSSTAPALAIDSPSSSFESPFKGKGSASSSKVPDFSKYMSKGNGGTNALFSYFMVGTVGAISAAGAKSTVQGELFFSVCALGRLFWGGWGGELVVVVG